MQTFPLGKLKNAMDEIVNDPALQPDQPKKGITYCNIAMFKLVQGLGFNLFWNEKADRPMMANEMIAYMDTSPCKFSKFFDPMMAYRYANEGHLVISGLKGIPHGHVAAIYPKQELHTSGTLKTQVPFIANCGKKNGIIALSYAYTEIPNFYLCL